MLILSFIFQKKLNNHYSHWLVIPISEGFADVLLLTVCVCVCVCLFCCEQIIPINLTSSTSHDLVEDMLITEDLLLPPYGVTLKINLG